MAERQLRSRSVAVEVNQDSQSTDPVVEYLHTHSDIGGSDETNFHGEPLTLLPSFLESTSLDVFFRRQRKTQTW